MSLPKSTFSPLNAKVESTEPLSNEDAKWIRLKKINYLNAAGERKVWEMAERSTKPANSDTDGVGVLAILRDPVRGPSLLLQKQFRPPLDKVTIEVPSGLVDEGESVVEAAIRELREETGYVGTVDEDDRGKDGKGKGKGNGGMVMWHDPGFCNTSTKMLFVTIDLSDPRNQNPKPQLEENEFIECFSLPLATLWEDLVRLDQEGFAVDARVATVAQGWEMAKRWRDVL